MLTEALYVRRCLPKSYKSDWSTSQPYKAEWLPIVAWVFAICAFLTASFLVKNSPNIAEAFIENVSRPIEILKVHGMKPMDELVPTKLGIKLVVSFWTIALFYPLFSMASITSRPLKRHLVSSNRVIRFIKVTFVLTMLIFLWWKFFNLLTLEEFSYGFAEFTLVHLAMWWVLTLVQPFLNSTFLGRDNA